jgi:hypothetical protein
LFCNPREFDRYREPNGFFSIEKKGDGVLWFKSCIFSLEDGTLLQDLKVYSVWPQKISNFFIQIINEMKSEDVICRSLNRDLDSIKKMVLDPDSSLKVPKCEIFDPFFFTPINPMWVGDLRTGEKKLNYSQ